MEYLLPGLWPVTSNTVTDINKIYIYIGSHVVDNHNTITLKKKIPFTNKMEG